MSESSQDRSLEPAFEIPPDVEDGNDQVLQYIVDNVPAWIFWKDRNCVYRGGNMRFALLCGTSHPRDLPGKTDYDLSWATLADRYRTDDRAVMESGVPMLNKEEPLLDGNGDQMVILTSKVPVRDEAGRVTGILGILFDITERKRMEIELGRAKEAAEQAATARSNFLANVSHELRTPLTLILGPVKESLAGGDLPVEMRALLERVQRNGFRLYNLVNDVLDFTKADAGRTAVRYERVDVVAVLAALVEDMRVLALARRLSLSLELELEAGASRLELSLDPKLFERIVLNLVSNALKFTPAGGTVRVRLSEDDDHIRVDVTDTGIGISEEDLVRLFQPFSQLDGSATRKHDGTGLGLTLVKHFAEVMGGSVRAVSQPGRGSTFTIHLPRYHTGVHSVPAPEPGEVRPHELGGAAWQQQIAMSAPSVADAPAPVAAPDPDSTLPRVLVADDNADLRAYITSALESEFSVVAVEDGLRAWETVQRHRFDVVVSDVMMPGLDGITLAARIKGSSDLANVPVILVTARGSTESATIGLDAGADDYVVKPFASEELRARVRAAVRMARLQGELRARAHVVGMAEVAAGALHNIGNVMNSINVSAGMLRETVEQSRIDLLEKLSALLASECQDEDAFAAFVATDPRGRRLPRMLSAVGEQLAQDRARALLEINDLRRHLEHVTAILASQQDLARPVSERIVTELPGMMHEAVRSSGIAAAGVGVEYEHGAVPALALDPHKLLQIVVNLLANARDSLRDARSGAMGVVRIRTRVDGDVAVVEISDNGVGISAADLPRIFEHGFTTKSHGHGFGLHISALAAAELGGSLVAHSDGPDRGATFTLTLPLGAPHV